MPRTFRADLREVWLSVIVDHSYVVAEARSVNESFDDWPMQSRATRDTPWSRRHAAGLAPLPSLGEQVEIHRDPWMVGQLLGLEVNPEPRTVRQREASVDQLGQPRHAVLDVRI